MTEAMVAAGRCVTCQDDRCPVCLRLHDAMTEAGRVMDERARALFRDALIRHRELRHTS
ncbi:hypothetical protein [Streptomyces sp. I05A-00742]|uniref:hypothetical protein n=1 Tax=Streptomyces sp. I05A-00742 TaxID=2732853 RepID=UPI00148977A3|nr:hypothetical protein [Streptomyces sp. I05A-00742]